MHSKSGNIGLRSNLLYCSKVVWVSQLISCVSLADTCRGNDIECYGHNAGIAASDPLSLWMWVEDRGQLSIEHV